MTKSMKTEFKTWKMKRLLSLALGVAFILSILFPGSFEVNAAGAKEYLASEYAGHHIINNGDTVIILDKDVTFGVIAINDGSLTIKNKAGENHTISTQSIAVMKENGEQDLCNLNIESGNINVTKRGIFVDNNMSIASGVTLNVNTTDMWDEDTSKSYYGIRVDGNLTTSGNVTVNTPDYYAVDIDQDLTMNGGSLTVSGSGCASANTLYMNDGKMNLQANSYYGCKMSNVELKGGSIYLYGAFSPVLVISDNLNVSGGYVELKVGNAFGRPWFLYGKENDISIADNMEVTFYDVTAENGIKTEVPEPYRLMDSNELGNRYGMFSMYKSYVIDYGVSDDKDKVKEYSAKAPCRVIIQEKKNETADPGATNSGTGNTGSTGSSTGTQNNSSTGASTGSTSTKYSSEWVNGKWYNADGSQTYQGILEWKCNSTGWWVEDTSGWYPVSQWQKIDGKWYYFLDSGYMDYSEYRDGYWLGSDGALVDGYFGEWKSDSKGWWFEDKSGWYPQSQWVWINGKCYYFESDGYLATNKYIDGYWVGSDGAY